MLQTSNLAVLLFFLLFSFLVLTKCQVFNLRVDRSRSLFLALSSPFILPSTLNAELILRYPGQTAAQCDTDAKPIPRDF